MKFTKSGGHTAAGPEAWFTGTVFIDTIRNPDEQSCVGCAHVRFTPGARTAWHTHPRGQTLYVTDGTAVDAAALPRGALEVLADRERADPRGRRR